MAANGPVLVPFMIFGAPIGKRLPVRLPERVYVFIIETVMAMSRLPFLVRR